MKHALLIAVVAFVIVGGAAVVWRELSDTAPQGEYRLIVISESVTLQRPGGAPQAVRGIVTVAAGDRVTTSATGRARLSWPNGTLTTLEEDSQIVIAELADGGAKTRIELIVGDVWSKVSRILGAGEYYEVQTQDTVAAVRGTVFRTTYRNQRSRVQTIERVVRVSLRSSDGRVDQSTGVDVQQDMAVDVDRAAVTARKLAPRRMTTTEKDDRVIDRIERERDLEDEDLVEELEKLLDDLNDAERDANQLLRTPTPTATPAPTPAPTPTRTPTPTPTPTTLAETPVPTPTPLPAVRLDGVFPRTIKVGDTFSLEGANFTSGRNIPRVTKVLVGTAVAEFSIVGNTSIFVTPQLSAGLYDVSAVTTEGDTVTLTGAITIQ